MLRHAVLGAGGIGGLIAAVLARAGAEVTLLLRPATLAVYDGQLRIESAVVGDFEVQVPAVSLLDREVDVLWLATKATQLEQALSLAPPDRVSDTLVVPLLNGVEHLQLLRSRYRRVAAAAIRVESEQIAPGRIRQTSPFLRLDLADGTVADELRRAGLDCRLADDDAAVLWEKLVFLAPLALVTTALDAPIGRARDDPRFDACRSEALAVAAADGVSVDRETVATLHAAAPETMQSSMQKDVRAGREPELDAIAGPIVNGGRRHHIPTAATLELVAEIRAKTGRG